MINVTPISIAATAQSYAAELTEKLCQPYCVNASIQPVVDVTYTIDDTSLVGTTLYVTVKAQPLLTSSAEISSCIVPIAVGLLQLRNFPISSIEK